MFAVAADEDLRYAGDNDELFFRDYLNEHPIVAKEYETLKLKLWKQYEHNRDAYTGAKTDFIFKWTSEAAYLFLVDDVDEEGIKKVLALHQDLQNANISSGLYEHDEVCTKEFLENLIGSFEETRRQVEEEMDREAMLGDQ